ncbi:hypothetical protein QWZ13_10095 [Reinekea marina]|uniref:hypothetical protein n=1 Tax=Reinekea marina TaxID=1310421 RepID=UPI0025B32E9C|nr:hypothetical protein [Reinekea marina]MDN3649263.1 hypothetical protein [Reinekea marina]
MEQLGFRKISESSWRRIITIFGKTQSFMALLCTSIPCLFAGQIKPTPTNLTSCYEPVPT